MKDLSELKTGEDIQKAVLEDAADASKKLLYRLLARTVILTNDLHNLILQRQGMLEQVKQIQVDAVKEFDEGKLNQDSYRKYDDKLDAF